MGSDSGPVFVVVHTLCEKGSCNNCPLHCYTGSNGYFCLANPEGPDPKTGDNEFYGSPDWCPFKKHAAVQVTYV